MLETYRAAIKKMGIDAKLVNDICVGNVLTPGNGYMGMCFVMLYHHELMNAQLERVLWLLDFPRRLVYRLSTASVCSPLLLYSCLNN